MSSVPLAIAVLPPPYRTVMAEPPLTAKVSAPVEPMVVLRMKESPALGVQLAVVVQVIAVPVPPPAHKSGVGTPLTRVTLVPLVSEITALVPLVSYRTTNFVAQGMMVL